MKFKRLLVLWLVGSLILGYGVGSSTSVVIHAFDQNPAGPDSGNEWVVLYNPADSDVSIGGWTLSSTHGSTSIVVIPIGTVISANGYSTYTHNKLWLDSTEESIILRDTENHEIDRTITANDDSNDNRYWVRTPNGSYIGPTSNWSFGLQTLEKGILRNGTCAYVVDGDTVDISPVGMAGIQRIRLVGINTPEVGENGYEEAKNFTIDICPGKEIEFDVDDEKQYDDENRILAVVYVGGTNLNRELLCNEYAEVLYMPPSEFNPYSWYNSCTPPSNFTSVIVSPLSVTRILLPTAQPNRNLTVSLNLVILNESSKPSGVIIKEYAPMGWNLTSSNPDRDDFNSETGEIRWLLYSTALYTRNLTYTVGVPSNATGMVEFSGVLLYTLEENQVTLNITGINTIQIEYTADTDNDGMISDFELLNYINLWVQELVGDFSLLIAIDEWAMGLTHGNLNSMQSLYNT